MAYADIQQKLIERGYKRVERDDRLLDIFPKENREKGIELWERWETKTIHILRLRAPFTAKKIKNYQLPRADIVTALLRNQTLSLDGAAAVITDLATAEL
jgi:hypothetical protein